VLKVALLYPPDTLQYSIGGNASMASVDDFASENATLRRDEATQPPSADDLKILVEIIEVTPEAVNFAYAGIAYSVARDQVSDISAISDTRSLGNLPSPPFALMTIRHDARFTTIHSVVASDVAAAVPFSMLGQQERTLSGVAQSERERVWARESNYEPAKYLAVDVAFSSNSGSWSGGAYDDSRLDDWCHPI
jgi:hypothetical protein